MCISWYSCGESLLGTAPLSTDIHQPFSIFLLTRYPPFSSHIHHTFIPYLGIHVFHNKFSISKLQNIHLLPSKKKIPSPSGLFYFSQLLGHKYLSVHTLQNLLFLSPTQFLTPFSHNQSNHPRHYYSTSYPCLYTSHPSPSIHTHPCTPSHIASLPSLISVPVIGIPLTPNTSTLHSQNFQSSLLFSSSPNPSTLIGLIEVLEATNQWPVWSCIMENSSSSRLVPCRVC